MPRDRATRIENRPYAAIEARMTIARWFADRHPANAAIDRLRNFVAMATDDRTTMLADVRPDELPDMLGALMLMQTAAA